MALVRRLLLSVLVLAFAFAAGEVAVRLFASPTRWALPTLRTPDGRVLGSLYAITSAVKADAADGTRAHPGTQIVPNLEVLGCYDHPELPYFDADGCVLYRCNAFGFRDDDFELAKAPDELRILAVGDSFTFGVGVRGEATWPQVLEHRLAATHPGPVQVVNAGFAGGHEPSQYAAWLRDDGLLFAPDTVVLGFCLNDCSPLVPMVARMPPPRARSPSRLVDLLVDRLSPPVRNDAPLDFGRILRKDPESWSAAQQGLREMRDLCLASGTRFVVAIFPMLSELGPDSPYRSLHLAVQRVCDELGVEWLDLAARIPAGDDRALWAHPTDQHPNEEVAARLADGIFEYLQDHPAAPGGEVGPAPGAAGETGPASDEVGEPRPAAPPVQPGVPDGPWRYVGKPPPSLRASDSYRPGPRYPDLRAALAAARPGDTIVVGPDGAQGPATIDKPVRILGYGEGTRPVVDGDWTIVADDVLVDRLRFAGRGEPRLTVEGARRVHITRCRFLDVGGAIELLGAEDCLIEDALVSGSATALRIAGGARNEVVHSIFDAGAWHAVEISDSVDNLFGENHVRQPGWAGVVVHTRATRNRIVRNTIEGGNVALALQSGGNVVEDNTILGSNHGILVGRTPLGRDPMKLESSWFDDPVGGSDVRPSGNRLLRNEIHECQSEGIVLKSARGTVVRENVVHGTGRHGIVLMADCVDVELVGNRVTSCGPEPILLLGSRGTALRENALDGAVVVVGDGSHDSDAPIVARAPGERPADRERPTSDGRLLLFGDLHVHSTFSDGASRPEENLAYARDVLGLDFLGLSDHAEALVQRPELWDATNALCAEWLVPGEFATFPGYETTYPSFWQGHFNTYFPHERGRLYAAPYDIQRWIPVVDAITPFRLLDRLRADGEDFFTVRHHFQALSDYWTTSPDDPVHLPMAEFTGVHGACFGHRDLDRNFSSRVEEARTHGATMEGALRSGRMLAVGGGSDSHFSFPGDHGLVAVQADACTREAILEAIRARRTYATTGAPIALEFTVDGRPMGSALDPVAPPSVRARVVGTADLRELRLLLSGDEIARGTLDGRRGALDLTLEAMPADGAWLQVEAVQADGQYAVSTPVWIRPGEPRTAPPETLRDKERMVVLVLAAMLRGWPYLPQPELGSRGPALCRDDPEAWARVEAQWPRWLEAVERLESIALELDMTDRAEMASLIERLGSAWQLPRAATLRPQVAPLLDVAAVRTIMGL